MILKSLGAFIDYSQHLCLQYLPPAYSSPPSIFLNGCNVKNKAQQFNP